MGGVIEKYNPLKDSSISRKREGQRRLRRGKNVHIKEFTFEDVRNDAINFGLATDVIRLFSAGKEASIYLAHWKGFPIVLKAYRAWKTPHVLSKKKGFIPQSGGKRTRLILAMIEDIAVKEFDLLVKCFRSGMHVPTPIGRVGPFLTMRFIGEQDGTPAPQLKDVYLENPEIVLNQILKDYLIMYRDVNYIHGDLSPYNILWWQEQPWIIDLPQAYHANVFCSKEKMIELLHRDIDNILAYFDSYGVFRDTETVYQSFLREYTPRKHFNEELKM